MDSNLSLPLSKERSAAAFLTAVDKVHDYAIFLMDKDGIVSSWNTAAEIIKGYTAAEAVGTFYGMFYTDEDRNNRRPEANLLAAARDGTFQEETWRRRKDGRLFWAMIEIIAITSDDGQLQGFCKIARDITGRKVLQDQLATERERAQVTLEAIGEAVLSTDADGKIAYLNFAAERLTGWRHHEAQGMPLTAVYQVSDEFGPLQRSRQLTERICAGQGLPPAPTAVLTSKTGKQFDIEDTATPIRLPDGLIAGGVVVFRDVTAARREFNNATYQATHDALTGLVNRAEFERCLERSLERAYRSGSPGALLFMDLDQFKAVNDTCGHDAGDHLLVQIASLYRSEVRERDVLARLGGDEFALIADHCTKEEALAIGQKILDATRGYRLTCGEQEFGVGVSVGIATFGQDRQTPQETLKLADNACYTAKHNGKNRIVCDIPLRAESERRQSDISWANRLADSISTNQLELYYQPIKAVSAIHADHGRPLLCEILLRLRDPEAGVILPGYFIPAAERHNLMPLLDRWVVEHFVRWLAERKEQCHQLEMCALNLSPKTIMDATFPRDLMRLLASEPDACPRLCFEITANAAMVNVARTTRFMNDARELGCKFSLVGVGAGTSALALLRKLPVDFIKFDETAAAGVTRSIVDEKLITSTNEIAHLLGRKTIVEFVEDQVTAQALSRIGVDYLQGQWIGPPRHLDQILAAPNPAP